MTLGILGGGQLGRMLALAGHPLDIRCIVVDPAADPPAAAVAEHIRAAYDDPIALDRLAATSELVTYEFENVPVDAARRLVEHVTVLPPPAALAAAQDRLIEKSMFQRLGIPTAPFAPVDGEDDLRAGIREIGLPAVLKTRRLGYDGKGQAVLRRSSDVTGAWEGLGRVPLLLERVVPFEQELSILAVRGRDGATVCYPLVENHHRDGILRLSYAPAPAATAAIQARAESYASRVLDELAYVGVLAMELFQLGDELLANEIAPRVHNSGHWTIEAAQTSQFENHLRAVVGLPLGEAAARGHTAMVNLIGTVPAVDAVLGVPGAHLHLYGKEPRPGRKLGHVTVVGDTPGAVLERVGKLRHVIPGVAS